MSSSAGLARPAGGRALLSLGSEHLALRPVPTPQHAAPGGNRTTVGEESTRLHQSPKHACTQGRGAASGAGGCSFPPRAEGREVWTSTRRKQHRRHSRDPAGFWEHPELVYITPRQGSRPEAWAASLNEALAGCTHVRDPRPGCSSRSSPHGPTSQGRSPGLGSRSGNGAHCPLLSKVRVGRVRPGACTCANGRK